MIKIKISTRGRYGLEAILDLAIHVSEGPVNLKSISERQGISDKYLEQLFIALKRDKIVDSIRGAQGGYILSKDPGDISVKDVLDVLEGPLAPVDCIIEDKENQCDRFEGCVTKVLWKKLMDELNSITESVTIGDLVVCFKDSNKEKEIEYFI